MVAREIGAAARWAAVLVLALGLSAARAQTTPAAAGGPSTGTPSPRLALCAACHGADGNSSLPGSPSLAGQPRVFLENTQILIREGLRPIEAMKGLLDGVSDAEIVALAEHYSRQAVRAQPAPRDAAAFGRGQELAARNLCGTCHLPSYSGQQQMPRLAGQRQDYLAQSMREFRDNKTQGRDTQMNGVLRGYSDRDIDDLAHYFAQLR